MDRDAQNRDIRLIGSVRLSCDSQRMQDTMRQLHRRSKSDAATGNGWFFRAFLPLGIASNLAFGVFVLARLQPDGWSGWLVLAAGAFCCGVAGWLAAALWSRFYWNNALVRQVTLWRRIADVFFGWLEEAPVPVDALHGLKRSLDEVVPQPD